MSIFGQLFALAATVAVAWATQGMSLWVQGAAIFATSMVVSRVFGQKPPKPQDNGVRQQVPPATVNSLPVVYGSAYLGGTFVDAVLSVNQKVMWYVLSVSSVSTNGLFTFDKTKMYFGDRLITFDNTEPAKVVSLTDGSGNVDTKIAGNLYIYLYRSNASGTITNLDAGGTSPGSGAPHTIMSTANGVPSGLEWTSTNRQMNGQAFAIVKLIYNTDAGTTQLQPVTFHASHTLNGTGVAKPGDVWADYLASTIYGGAVSSSLIDTTSATALNTYSDELITYIDNSGNPATQPRYRINGVLDTGTNVLENVDKLLECCDSWMTYNSASGKWSIVINKAQNASMSFDDGNIIGDIKTSTLDINQSVNQIEAKFPNKLNKDIPGYVYLTTPSELLYPNEPVNKYTTEFALVNDSVQAQYLANRILEQAREDLIVTITTTYYGIQANAGDVVSITNSVYGWTNKLFRVLKVQEAALADGTLGATLDLSEYNAEVYDDKDITEFHPASNSDLPAPNYFSSLSAPTVTASYPTAAVPSFDVQVFVPVTGRVTNINLYYTTSLLPSTSDWKFLDVATNVNSEPFTNNTNYTFSNLALPTGTYYFAYTVGNNIGNSALSALSGAFAWSPSGSTGPTGPRSSSGYLYYALASQTAPSAPTASGYNFTTGTFSSLSSNWSTTFTAPNPVTNPATQAGSKFWACRYNVSEASYGGAQTVTLTAVFNWTNLDGLVTFTNVSAPSGTTFIDGGNIITATITANKITTTSLSAISANIGTVTAGDLHANNFWIGTGNSYTTCQFKDNQSTYPVYSTAMTVWDGTNQTITQSSTTDVLTTTSLIFSGPNYHSTVPVNQRIRNSDTGIACPMFVTVTALQDHYLSLWFRYYVSGVWQSWQPLGNTVADTTGGDGYSTITWGNINLSVGNNAAVQFGLTPTDHSYVPYDPGKLYIKNFFVVAQAINL